MSGPGVNDQDLNNEVTPFPTGSSISLPSASHKSGSPTMASPSPSTSTGASTAVHHTPVGLIAGVALGVGIPFILAVAAAIWLWRRRNTKSREAGGVWDSPYNGGGSVGQANVLGGAAFTTPSREFVPSLVASRDAYASSTPPMSMYEGGGKAGVGTAVTRLYNVDRAPQSRSSLSYSVATSGLPTADTSSIGQSDFKSVAPARVPFHSPTASTSSAVITAQHEKLREANERLWAATVSASGSAKSADRPSGSSIVNGAEQPVMDSSNLEGPADVVIQHRDGGVVHELPPPYTDLSSVQGTIVDTSHSAE
jgi:hypothetical protein